MANLSAAFRLNDEARRLFEELGSTAIKELAFRDSWVFVGAKGIENKSPFEQVGPALFYYNNKKCFIKTQLYKMYVQF